MKKEYQKPAVDKIEFCYREQVVAASGNTEVKCTVTWLNEKGDGDSCNYGGVINNTVPN